MEKEEKKAVLPNVVKMSVASNKDPKNYKVGMFVNFNWLKDIFNAYFDDEDSHNPALALLYSEICEAVIDQSVVEMNKDYGIITGVTDIETVKPYHIEARINDLLKENEQLKSDLRDMKASHATLAELLMQKDDEIEKLHSGEVGYKSGVQDGVYVVFKDGSYSSWEDTKEELSKLDKKNVECIGIVWNGQRFGVGLCDHVDMTPLMSQNSNIANDNTAMGYAMRRQPIAKAMLDFTPKDSNDYLRKQSLDFNLPHNEYIPAIGQLAVMFLYESELNDALRAVGGEPLCAGEYWSCNLEGYEYFYALDLNTGDVYARNGKSNNCILRLVTDFNL